MSVMHRLWIKKYMLKKPRSAHHSSCNWKLIISCSILSQRGKLIPSETLSGSKGKCQTILQFFFQVHKNNSITINRSNKWITVTIYFRNGNITYIIFTFGNWLFSVTATWHFRLKSSHFNKTLYCKPIDRALKMQ